MQKARLQRAEPPGPGRRPRSPAGCRGRRRGRPGLSPVSGVVERKIGGVTEAEDVTGPYDVIVRAEATTVDELGKLVVARIQAVEGITRTLTCPVVHL